VPKTYLLHFDLLTNYGLQVGKEGEDNITIPRGNPRVEGSKLAVELWVSATAALSCAEPGLADAVGR